MEIIQTKKRLAELLKESLRYGHFVSGHNISANCANCGKRVDCTNAIYDYAPGHVARKLRIGMTDHLEKHCGECDTCGTLYGRHAEDCTDREARHAQ